MGIHPFFRDLFTGDPNYDDLDTLLIATATTTLIIQCDNRNDNMYNIKTIYSVI